MYSRAHLLIEREFYRLSENEIWGIQAFPVSEENIFEWAVKLRGLRGTLWEKGVFRLYMKFDEHYNTRPPQVCFHTIPFHPNVDMITGRPCIEFIDDLTNWNGMYGITTMLLTIQAMLSNPVLENAVNAEAVKMILKSPHAYQQMILDCVVASQRVDAGLNPYLEEGGKADDQLDAAPQAYESAQSLPARTERSAKISFDDYHRTWCGIATSKSRLDTRNPLVEKLKDHPNLQNMHYGLSHKDIKEQVDKQLEEHNTLMYGRFKKEVTVDESKAAKMSKVERMRKIYFPQRTPTPISGRQRTIIQIDPDTDPGDHDKEVNDLVAWATKLDEEAI